MPRLFIVYPLLKDSKSRTLFSSGERRTQISEISRNTFSNHSGQRKSLIRTGIAKYDYLLIVRYRTSDRKEVTDCLRPANLEDLIKVNKNE